MIARWHSIDPLAEYYYSTSSYHYALNNPIRYVDVFGMGGADFFDENGNKIGTDGKDDDVVYIVTDKEEKKEIKNKDKKNGTTDPNNVKSKIETTKTELKESLNVLDRTEKNGGNREEASVVTENGEVIRGETGSSESQTLSDGTVVKTTEVPANEGNNNTFIHSHPTAVNVTSDSKIESSSATVPGPKDPGVFKGYKRNIIVGNLGYASGQKQLDGSISISTPSQGAVIYDRNSKPLIQLKRKAIKKIIK